jgi:hypothetical protein
MYPCAGVWLAVECPEVGVQAVLHRVLPDEPEPSENAALSQVPNRSPFEVSFESELLKRQSLPIARIGRLKASGC